MARRMGPRASSALLLFFLGGCAGLRQGLKPVHETQALTDEARAQGIPLDDPLALDAATVKEVRSRVGAWGTPSQRMRRLMRFLVDDGQINFRYALNHSLTAQEAYRQRRGDCMAYTNLFVALARALDVPVQFVRRSEVPVFYDYSDVLYVSSHMAVAGHNGWSTLLVDFSAERTDARTGYYEDLSDADAFALFYDNVAMEWLVAGRAAEAERLLRFLIGKRPQLKELQSNLGVVLMHEGRQAEALDVYRAALGQFPGDLTLYTNAAQAARAKGESALADQLLLRAGQLTGTDPAFLYNRGLVRYQSAMFQRAAEDFRSALRSQPNNAVILTWLVRACAASGQTGEARKAFRHLVEVAPQSRFIGELQQQFPVLAANAR